MAKIIIKDNAYDTNEAIANVFNYVSNSAKSNGLIGAQNMLVNNSLEQIEAVNRYFYNNTKKKVIHFIIAFAPDDCIEPMAAYYAGYEICELLPAYQIKFCVHQNTNDLHMHFAMNPVSLIDGHKFYFNDRNRYSLLDGIRKILDYHGIKISYATDTSNDFTFSE